MSKTVRDHLVSYLTDAYSIEAQVLAQLRSAPDLAGAFDGAFRASLADLEVVAS